MDVSSSEDWLSNVVSLVTNAEQCRSTDGSQGSSMAVLLLRLISSIHTANLLIIIILLMTSLRLVVANEYNTNFRATNSNSDVEPLFEFWSDRPVSVVLDDPSLNLNPMHQKYRPKMTLER